MSPAGQTQTPPGAILDGSMDTPHGTRTRVTGWGGCQAASVRLVEAQHADELPPLIRACRASGEGAIARGLGRSYGDAAQLAGGLVIALNRLKRFDLDPQTGTVTAQAGVTLGELLAELVPQGWMVPVVPGTQHVTVGGAIASDIHGKNHGASGTFSRHVDRIGLMTSAGEVLTLEPGQPSGLFEATAGGMGLTGLIVWAAIRLEPISGPLMSVDTDRVDDLEQAFAALSAPGGAYRVAWIDLLSSKRGRGVVTRADHLPGPDDVGRTNPAVTVRARATVPAGWPEWPLRPGAVRLFNEQRFRRSPRRERDRPIGLGRHLFPLDALEAWPRLYGRDGMLQYQFVVPSGAEGMLIRVVEELHRSRLPCYLAVLKDFGPAAEGPLSFPVPGWTLTMDIPRRAPGLDDALHAFDELVASCGGRVYLSKDVRMRPSALDAMYPRLSEWRELRDRADPDRIWRSDLAVRTGLLGPEQA